MNRKLYYAVRSFSSCANSSPRPFPQKTSYYSASRHSGLEDGFGTLLWCLHDHGAFGDLHVLVKQGDKSLLRIAREMEKYFVLGTMVSAVFDAIHCIKFPSARENWFHEPFWGGYQTFNRIWISGKLGWFNGKAFRHDKVMSNAHTEYKRVMELYQKAIIWSEEKGNQMSDPEKKRIWVSELPVLKGVLLQSLCMIESRIKAQLETCSK